MKEKLISHRIARHSLAIGCALALAACGQKSDAPAATGQWVAKVNEREITVHQVNAELAGSPMAGSVPAATAQRRTVEALVDRRLLVDAAVKAGADRTPDVQLAIDKAREQIIAQAYLRQTVGAAAKPSAAEVSAYFNKHPELFAQRKQFDMRQVLLEHAAFTDDVKRMVDGAASLDALEAELTAQNVKFSKGRMLRTSAELPPAMLDKLDTLTSGKPFMVRTPSNVVVGTLAFVKDVPVSEQEAAPQIQQYLSNVQTREAVAAEVARLRKEGKVEYKAGYGPESPTASAALDRGAAGLR